MRDFDVVLYGASGFTGKQTAEYFARNAPPGGLRWAIAGRNLSKLEAVRGSLGPLGESIEILVAEAHDQPAIDAIVARTRVLLTTAGPYALYGTQIVDACVRHRTHYVDITGETTWVRDLIDRYHDEAAATGTRIVPFCGFDSVPSDLGSFLLVRHLQEEGGMGHECTGIRAFHQMRGGLNGGTMATAFHLYESGQSSRAVDPFLLSPGVQISADQRARSADPRGPRFDPDLGQWTAPFVMGPINTRVVRRSESLFRSWGAGYGEAFTYQEYTRLGRGLGGAVEAAFLSGASALFGGVMATPLRRLLQPLVPQPGEGPSEETMNHGWFRCDLIGRREDGRVVRGLIRDQGDPGNRATVKFLCESALCLALDEPHLPGGLGRGGILTPATALGDPLADRLRRTGMIIQIGI